MKKISIVAIILALTVTLAPAFGLTTGNGRGPGNGGGGGGGVCQNLVTTWDADPYKTPLDAGQTGVYYLSITNNCASMQDVKLTTTDKGMTFDPASFSLNSSAKTKVKVTVTMPAQNNRNDAWFTIKFVCSVGNGKIVKFGIKYKTQICCTYVATWVTNPNGKVGDSQTAYTFPLDLTNKCTDKITFTLAASQQVVKFSRNSFVVEPGKAGRVNVIIGAHNKKITGKNTYTITITTNCGNTKKITFTIVYK